MGCSSQVFTPIRLRFTSFFIGEMVVDVSQNFRISWWSPSPKESECCLCGSLFQILSPMRSTWILCVMALDKRYLVLQIVLDMLHWEGLAWFDIIAIKGAFMQGKLSLVFCATSCAYESFIDSRSFNFFHHKLAPSLYECFYDTLTICSMFNVDTIIDMMLRWHFNNMFWNDIDIKIFDILSILVQWKKYDQHWHNIH